MGEKEQKEEKAETKDCSRWTKCIGKGNNNVPKTDNTNRKEPKK